MKVLCWNVRRIGGGGKLSVIKDLILRNKILFIALVETKSGNLSENWVRRVLGSFEFD